MQLDTGYCGGKDEREMGFQGTSVEKLSESAVCDDAS